MLIARHLRVDEMHNYMNDAPLRDLRNPETLSPVAADESGRSDQRFVMDAVARRGDEERRVTATGRDIYATTAPLVVEALERISGGEAKRAGAFALAELVDAAKFLRQLSRAGELVVETQHNTKVS
jgi:hypothetical protein